MAKPQSRVLATNASILCLDLIMPAPGDGFTVPFTLHGLRGTYISAAHSVGISDRHVKLLVNHAVPSSDVHGGYVLLDVDALRPSTQRIADWLRGTACGSKVRPADCGLARARVPLCCVGGRLLQINAPDANVSHATVGIEIVRHGYVGGGSP
jgi:hypothetical protein